MQFEYGMAHVQHQLGEQAADNKLQRDLVVGAQKHSQAKDMVNHEWGIEQQRMGLTHSQAKETEEVTTREQAKREKATARTEVWKATAMSKVPTSLTERYKAKAIRDESAARLASSAADLEIEKERSRREEKRQDTRLQMDMQDRADRRQERKDNQKVMAEMMARLGGGDGSVAAPSAASRQVLPRHGSGGGARASRKLRNKAAGQ